ncbi:MAG: hypothetical protein IJX17_02515 [Clostridia bacterium]|nr:hypothetical protein [Clostridia bacterium]
MEERYQLIDYYIKDLTPDEQRGIYGDLRDLFTSFQREIINDVENDYKNIFASGLFKNNEQLEKYLKLIVNSFIKINERMIKNGRPPLFKNPNNLKESMDLRDKLIIFMPESRCNEIICCNSFKEYRPITYKIKS